MKKKHTYTMIVATDLHNGIGKNNQLAWHLSEDLKRFKSITTGHPILMGRKTWESLPKKPLPDRHNIILTHDQNYKAEGATVINQMEDINHVVKAKEEVFIIGGAEIYNLYLPWITKIHLTLVWDWFDCDAKLEKFSRFNYYKLNESNIRTDEKSGVEYQFLTLEKRK